NTAAAALGTIVALKWLENEGIGVVVATASVTALLLIFGEVIPKTLAARFGERVAFWYVIPLEIIDLILLPLVLLLRWISVAILRPFGGATVPRSLVSQEELRSIISVGHREGAVEEEEAKMLHKVLDFGERQVREVMVPHTEMVTLKTGTTLDEFLSTYVQFAHTRFPIYKENLDDIVGVLTVKDVVQALARGDVQGKDGVTHLVRPGYFVPETKHIDDLFTEMRSTGNQLALAVDEHGGIAGLVTLKQLVEEIVGKVGEEGEEETEEFEALGEGAFQVDGGMRVDEANEKLGLNLPEGEYETVAGFVLSVLGHIPKVGEHFRYDGLRVSILEMKGVKIEKIRLMRN
ncbi:MAG: hemolysin family protein, partial [Dehalococcoidia bacterium]